MTGIERLRKLSEDIGYKSLWSVLMYGREDDWDCKEYDGKTLDGTLTAIADQIEREHAEDRDAIAWVREHGGLERVKWLLDWCLSHDSKIEQLDFDFWLSGRVMHELGFEGDMADRDEIERRLAARLMPEGMEWPTVDGKPVVIGERMRSCGIDDCKVVGIDPVNARLFLAFDDIEKEKATYFPDFAKYCHRPAVLAADGEPLEVGQTVWRIDTGTEYWVKSGQTITSDAVVIIRKTDCDCESEIVKASQLTHTNPEPPDSLELIADEIDRLREEVALHLGDYLYDEDGNDSIQFSMELVAKRCRALAERERGER